MEERCKNHSREYQILLNNIPGGVQQCLNDADYTMLEVNQGFCEMFGFTREELTEQFHDHFIEMIHPLDRQALVQEVADHLKKNEKMTFQYRVLCKDGSYKWVMDNAQLIYGEEGGERLFCILLDITESRAAREELRLSIERFHIIMDQTADIIFEWNVVDDTVIFSQNWQKKFGYPPIEGEITRNILVDTHIHPSDMTKVLNMINDTRMEGAYTSAELRIRKQDGQYIWCRVRATKQYDENDELIKVVGIITDIDQEKQMIDDLRRRAEQDALTGLYNREETEGQIRQYLAGQPNEKCALLMIDTDNFKGINDSQGHLFGDAVLSELAACMKRMTRQSDVVGRIGGDEFTIFLKNVPSKDMVKEKAASLLEQLGSMFQMEKQSVEVTCSAGVAIYPDDGRDFQTLYHSADLALYQAKYQGKNQYMMFDSLSAPLAELSGYTSLGAAIDSDRPGVGNPGDLINYVFQILYDSEDISHAIQLILEIVGKRFDVSRAYIFENSEDNKYTDNTYEWCNDGIIPQKDNLQHFPYDAVAGYMELFKNDSIFYCRDIHSLTPAQAELLGNQGICSTLQCAIHEGEVFRGFVGFDECTGLRLWTKEEIGMLSLISQLLTTFLQKKRATERDRQLAVQLNTILDVQDAYIYAIDQKSYELLYLNHKTRELDSAVSVGMTCYQAFFEQDGPCKNCPLSGGDGEIYNSKYGLWTRVKVAPMKWGEREAYLLSCFDITEYRRMQESCGTCGKG